MELIGGFFAGMVFVVLLFLAICGMVKIGQREGQEEEPRQLEIDQTVSVNGLHRHCHTHHGESIRALTEEEVEILATNTRRCEQKLADLNAASGQSQVKEALPGETVWKNTHVSNGQWVTQGQPCTNDI